MKRKVLSLTIILVSLLVLASPLLAAEKGASKDIILATTTSTQDTGLLDVLIPDFEKGTVYRVKTIAVGSGQALVMGARGEADVLLVHSPQAEEKFLSQGFGINRKLVMHNDFIIVGPEEDPARIRGLKSVPMAFKNIFRLKALFISRGDNSGTHAEEKAIWEKTGIDPEKEKWYQQTGLGMGQTLAVASEKEGYCLTDRATYLALKKNLHLSICVQGDKALMNIYHVIEVNPARWPKVNSEGAKSFSTFLVSKSAQEIIGSFGRDKFGQPLFISDAGKKEEDLGK